MGGYGVVAGAKEREDAAEVLSSLAQRVCFLAQDRNRNSGDALLIWEFRGRNSGDALLISSAN
jgi:hypothetical protein